MRAAGKVTLLATASALAILLASCKKKADDQSAGRAVQTGYYSLAGLYAINANGTYSTVKPNSCQTNFLLYLKDGGRMELQRACQNVSGTWSYSGGILAISSAGGLAIISGPVEFESDGITIDVNSAVDNTRYQLFRN